MPADDDKLELQKRLNTRVSVRLVRRVRSDKVRYFQCCYRERVAVIVEIVQNVSLMFTAWSVSYYTVPV